ncbi:MAG: DUF885 domain-containing protein [Porticoccaceae bacterium]|nr:DUF885 domain-containing protein [Porticoccaceae bacterium]
MFKIITIVLTALSIQSAFAMQSEQEKLNSLYDEIWHYTMITSPTYATYVGYPGQNGRWPDPSLKAAREDEDKTKGFLRKLRAIDTSELTEDALLGWKLVEKNVTDEVDGYIFPEEYILIHQRAGVQQDIADALSLMPKSNRQDFLDRLTRLRGAADYIDKNIVVLQKGLAKKITPPKITLRDVPDQIRNTTPKDISKSPLLKSFSDFPSSITAKGQAAIIAEATDIVENNVYPAFARLLVFLEDEYIPSANQSIALSDVPSGDNWYRHRARRFTTTNLTPEQIHKLGLSEVKRIRLEMDKVITLSGFEGSFDEFTAFLRTDPQFYKTSAEDLLAGYRDIAKRADPELAKLFGKLPRSPYGVIEIPSYAAKSQTTAYYQGGSLESGRAGYFYANTYALNTRPTWEMEALTLHEAMPGHHLQISLARELPETHVLLQNLSYTGFVEGWGLYAESLGDEMGFYKDPYSKFGQLTYEMWRAVRLVVDTGMHLFGWDRQKAINFFAGNTAKSLHDIEVEIDRYISWPGQALAYKIGELKFKELRARAVQKLGEKFDIRRFHDQLHAKGALPLDILDARMDEWIESEL